MTISTSSPRFRLWDRSSLLIMFLSAILVLSAPMLIGISTIAPFAKPESVLYALRSLRENQALLYTVVGVLVLAGVGGMVYMQMRQNARFGSWLEANYGGELEAKDAGIFHENQPVVKPTGIYHARSVGFLYSDLVIDREDLPVAA